METKSEKTTNRQSPADRAYGEIVYWGTIAASILVIISITLAFTGMRDVMDPAYLFSSIWSGKSADAIWMGATGHMPDTYWYLQQLRNGDSLVMFGIVLGVFSVIPASFAAAIIFLKQGRKFFGAMGFITGILILLPCLSLL